MEEKSKINNLQINNVPQNTSIQKQPIMEGELTGYPSIDKPWLKYYNLPKNEINLPTRTIYEELYLNNVNYGNNLAIEFFGSKINYEKLINNIDNTAKALEEYGVKKGSFVTICAAGVPETVYSFYALSKLGAIANFISPHFDKEQLIKRIEECESDVLIVMDTFYDVIKDSIKKSRIKSIIILPTLNSSLLKLISKKYKLTKNSNEIFWNKFILDGRFRKDSTTIGYEEQQPVAMVYSSGTTGASKGILLSNDSFQNSLTAYKLSGVDMSRGQKFYQIIPPWFSTGLSTSINLPLSCGVSIFMDPRFEREIFVKNIVKHHPNYTVAPTSMYEGFLNIDIPKNADLSFFTKPFEGGEPLRPEVKDAIDNVFHIHGNKSELLVGYGQCEGGATITTQIHGIQNTKGSVGYPLPGVTVSIFDDNFNELKYNERGLVLANTPCRMIGYYNNEEANNLYFHIDKNGTKWNCTGDVGYISESGELFIEGRSSDYVVIEDKKIYNFDIENVIMTIPEIKLCDVFGKIDSNGKNAIVAHIILTDDIYIRIKDNEELVKEEFIKIQNKIYETTQDIFMIPTIFKLRTNFPYAKSGKRDIQQLRNETEGFYELPIHKKQKQKVKNN